MLIFITDVAKDSDASLGTRASAAKDAIGDKADESSNKVYTHLRPSFVFC